MPPRTLRSLRDNSCIAVSDQDCAKSKVCKDEAACTAQAGACIATSDVMCAATRGCKQDGRCTATEGSCQLTSMEDCRKSNGCSEEGRCIFFKKKNTLPIFVPGLRQRPDIVGCRADRGSCLQSVVCATAAPHGLETRNTVPSMLIVCLPREIPGCFFSRSAKKESRTPPVSASGQVVNRSIG